VSSTSTSGGVVVNEPGVAQRLSPRFWPYLISRIVSVTGDGAALAALALAVYQRDPSALAVPADSGVKSVDAVLRHVRIIPGTMAGLGRTDIYQELRSMLDSYPNL
jgi:hypothetical protein